MMKSLFKLLTLCLLLFGSGVQTAVADTVVGSEQRITADNNPHNNIPQFGYRVAIDGTRMAIGGRRDYKVHIYDFDGSTWQLSDTLTSSDGVDRVGAIALQGNRLAVGFDLYDRGGDNYTGGVIIYELNGSSWERTATLTASDGKKWDSFGNSIALDGDHLAVGAWVGAVYTFEYSGGSWSQTQKLVADDGAAGDKFGASYRITLSGDHLAVGAGGADIGGKENQGAVYTYVYNAGSWSQTQKLVADDGAAGDDFGKVSLFGNYLAVGASGDDSGRGAVYLFELTAGSWSQSQKLTADDGVAGDGFGLVRLSGNRLAVAAYEAGMVYLFDYDGSSWKQSPKIDVGGHSWVNSMALDNDFLVAGNSLFKTGGRTIGEAYVYALENPGALSVIVSGLADSGMVDLVINGSTQSVGNGKTDTLVAMGNDYSVSIATQPVGGSCSIVGNSSGTMGGSNVVVVVDCEQDSYTIGGTVTLPFTTGTPAVSVTLQNNGGDDLTLSKSGQFTFSTSQANSSNYAVTIASSTPTMTCTVNEGSGQVLSENVIDIEVNCAGHGTVHGIVQGLIAGTTINVKNDVPNSSSPSLTETLSLTKGGHFEFPTALLDMTGFNITITGSNPQNCLFNGSDSTFSSIMDSMNYITPIIICDGTGYPIEADVSGLSSSENVVLHNEGVETYSFFNGNSSFPTLLADGTNYKVSVYKQPEGKTCKLANESGTISGASAKVSVTCTATSQLNLNVKVSGLGVGKTVVVSDKVSSDNKTFTANATATLTSQNSGASYNVVVTTQPSGQHCKVIDGSGTLTTATEIAVKCYNGTFKTFYVTGKVVGLASGQSLTLQNNGGDDLAISGNGGFVFATALFNHDKYNVTVSKQPTKQTCTVSNGSGEILGKTVSNIVVTCKANTAGDVVTVGGTLNGLNGGEVVIANSTVDVLKLTADGNFTFANSLVKGSSYFVYVKKQPAGQMCTVSKGSGTANANVKNVMVTCKKADAVFTVGGSVSGLTQALQQKRSGKRMLAPQRKALSKTLVLQNNGSDDLSLTADGSFTFATPIAKGGSYNVTVKTMPNNVNCTVNGGSGSNIATNVSNVSVTCQAGASVVQSVPSLGSKTLALLVLLLAAICVVFIRQRRWV